MGAHQHITEHQPGQSQADAVTLGVQDGAPQILFIADLADRLGMSVRTIDRRLRAGAFPIPELPRLDQRRRWSSVDVNHFIATGATEGKSMRLVGRKAR